MKIITLLAASGALAIGATSQAAAGAFTPRSARFSATGQAGLGAQGGMSISCILTIKGKTTRGGRAKITSAQFSGSDARCASTTFMGLPWRTRAGGSSGGVGAATIFNVAVASAVTGACGPGQAPVQVFSNGGWNIVTSLPPACSFSAVLQTSPSITVGP
ncbi:MAG: hypothetical protein ACR2FH_07585 [Caulobacteraceae bacterium]